MYYKKHSYTMKLVLALLFGLLAMIVPMLMMKLIFGLIALWMITSFSKKQLWFFIIFGIILVGMTIVGGFLGFSNGGSFFGFKFDASPIYSQTVNPDKVIEDAENIEIGLAACDITFDPTFKGVKLSSELPVDRSGNTLSIRQNEFNGGFNFGFRNVKKYILIVGTKDKHSSMDIEAASANIKGSIKSDNLRFAGASLTIDINAESNDVVFASMSTSIKGTIKSDEVKFSGASVKGSANIYGKSSINVEGASAEFTNSVFSANDIYFNGASIKYSGKVLSTNSMNFNGMAQSFDIEASNLKTITADGPSVKGTIKFTDKWTDSRNIETSGFGKIKIYILSDNTGNFDVDSDTGAVSVIRY